MEVSLGAITSIVQTAGQRTKTGWGSSKRGEAFPNVIETRSEHQWAGLPEVCWVALITPGSQDEHKTGEVVQEEEARLLMSAFLPCNAVACRNQDSD